MPLSFTHFRRLDYGVLHNQRCERFKLDKELASDNHFLGHLDGKLYVNDTEEPYDVDSYCIEFINMGTIEVIAVQFRLSISNTWLTPSLSLSSVFLYLFCFLSQLETFVCFVQEVAKFQYYPYGLTVSCIFLGITLIVYLCLPKVRIYPVETASSLAHIDQLKIMKFPRIHIFSSSICMERRWSAT